MEINQILICRENKSNLIKSYTKDYQVITLKANIVIVKASDVELPLV